ncbi:hybrid-cluster NAD(P)-dependent oxidoreductase [Vibrio sp. JC009]|uniref:hybrid-cluster NAD(P)-dependent oxidoreductase n=1 Tax=Vibrio sp. JC009 TaxID=2912314 RepID=UPI0023B13003|nr:hybrid-cluster NAD(P)-dependent oxidoreductase [Vibrio sp. JC009]WED20864.1 hybrid-cluster NAD(P)-dependent oxidoreductase [Vibrio sp. JC009]
MNAWLGSDSIELVCKEKWSETPDTVSFSLVSADKEMQFDFKPGQFCSLGVELGGKTEYRAYSISSVPSDSQLSFTVKRVEGGLVSNHIVDNLKEGDKIQVLKPAGQFNSVDCEPTAKVTMVSAGCGISPVMSMVREWLNKGIKLDIDFIHQARSKENTIYFAELEQLADEYENFHLKLLLKDNSETVYSQGRLDKEWLVNLSPDILERSVYLCGPVGFMQDGERYLSEIGFDMSRFYEESFTPLEQCASDEQEASGAVKIAVPDFGMEQEADAGSMLIDALESGGLPIIAACRSGICGSCRVKVKEGEVERTSTETLTEADIEQGYALACSCKVNSDVEVSLN